MPGSQPQSVPIDCGVNAIRPDAKLFPVVARLLTECADCDDRLLADIFAEVSLNLMIVLISKCAHASDRLSLRVSLCKIDAA